MSWDPVWEEVFKSQQWGKYPAVELVRFVARNFYAASDRRAVRLLEVGCGPGANLWFMAREGFSVYGVDGSPTAIELASARLDSECPGWTGSLEVGDIGKLPFPDGYFDAAIEVEAVYCNPARESAAIYGELGRVVKSGGRLFSMTFANGSWGDGSGEAAGHHAWFPAEGPMAGKGYSRFTSLDEVTGLVAPFLVESVELVTRSAEERRKLIREWVIEAVKP